MNAIVIAGGVAQPGEALYEASQGGLKSMIEIDGKPMIQWVLDALSGSRSVEGVIIAGLTPESGVTCLKPLYFISNQGEMLQNIFAGIHKTLELDPNSHHVLAVSSDIPAITPEMIDWEVETAMETDHDVYYGVIPKQVMEARYPGSRRSYIRLRDVEVCGADMNIIRTMTVNTKDDLWGKIIAARKSALKQASLIGFDTLFLLLFHLINLQQAERLASKRLGLKGRVLVSPYAEIGMDIDKPHQLEMVQADLLSRRVSV
jgi:molybdopterin-guanine dinucleotide biosynthesis protein A